MKIFKKIIQEEVQFKMNKSEFPILDVIKANLDPFSRLFNTVAKWQRSEKKWMDGSFTDLNSEIVESDCEDFWREIYKINKIFTNQIKKRKIELQAKLSEKRKSKKAAAAHMTETTTTTTAPAAAAGDEASGQQMKQAPAVAVETAATPRTAPPKARSRSRSSSG